MRIALGADHAAWQEKNALCAAIEAAGHTAVDCGTDGPGSVDYPDLAEQVARAVAAGDVDRGVLVCGTGIGMSIAANKVPGIRAARCSDADEGRLCRQHNDANVLCLGARTTAADVLLDTVRAFIDTDFDGGRHARRVDKLSALDP